jgi:hypothetical protein
MWRMAMAFSAEDREKIKNIFAMKAETDFWRRLFKREPRIFYLPTEKAQTPRGVEYRPGRAYSAREVAEGLEKNNSVSQAVLAAIEEYLSTSGKNLDQFLTYFRDMKGPAY